MNKQWRYRNGDKPFSVTEIEMPLGNINYISVSTIGLMRCHGVDGMVFDCDGDYDLRSHEPYSAYVLDDKVYVTDYKDNIPITAHWAGLDEHGNPSTFIEGGTSFTRMEGETVSWTYCEKIPPTTEENK
jgi:hypothetical protein